MFHNPEPQIHRHARRRIVGEPLVIGAVVSIGSTAFIGAAWALAILTIVPSQWFPKLIPVPTRRSKAQADGMTMVFWIVAIYGIGIIVEDLSDKYADQNPDSRDFLVSGLLQNEHDILVANILKPSGAFVVRTALGNELADRKLFSSAARISADKTIAGKLEQDRPLLRGENWARGILPLYFRAKNKAYSKTTYFDELSDIQARIGFARAASLSMWWLMLVAIARASTAAAGIWLPSKTRVDQLLPSSRRDGRRLAIRAAWAALTFFVLHWLIGIAFEHEESQFNSRVFGYFMTEFIDSPLTK